MRVCLSPLGEEKLALHFRALGQGHLGANLPWDAAGPEAL